jgi:hypothetical protein
MREEKRPCAFDVRSFSVIGNSNGVRAIVIQRKTKFHGIVFHRYRGGERGRTVWNTRGGTECRGSCQWCILLQASSPPKLFERWRAGRWVSPSASGAERQRRSLRAWLCRDKKDAAVAQMGGHVNKKERRLLRSGTLCVYVDHIDYATVTSFARYTS